MRLTVVFFNLMLLNMTLDYSGNLCTAKYRLGGRQIPNRSADKAWSRWIPSVTSGQ